jgi:hypothetical protein
VIGLTAYVVCYQRTSHLFHDRKSKFSTLSIIPKEMALLGESSLESDSEELELRRPSIQANGLPLYQEPEEDNLVHLEQEMEKSDRSEGSEDTLLESREGIEEEDPSILPSITLRYPDKGQGRGRGRGRVRDRVRDRAGTGCRSRVRGRGRGRGRDRGRDRD